MTRQVTLPRDQCLMALWKSLSTLYCPDGVLELGGPRHVMSKCGHPVAEVACVDVYIPSPLGGDTEALWLFSFYLLS